MQNVATQNSKARQTAGRRCFNIVWSYTSIVLIRISRITSVVGATDRVITGNTIWRIALMIISSRHGESESQASINANR